MKPLSLSLSLFLLIGLTSCHRDSTVAEPIAQNIPGIRPPSNTFVNVNFRNGLYSSTENEYLSSFPLLQSKLQSIAEKFGEGDFVLHFGPKIATFRSTSSTQRVIRSISAKNLNDLIYTLTGQYLLDYAVKITVNKNSYSISAPELFAQGTDLKTLIGNMRQIGDSLHIKGQGREDYKVEMTINPDLSVLMTSSGKILSKSSSQAVATYSMSTVETVRDGSGYDCNSLVAFCDYNKFKECVGDLWFAPVLNVAVCGGLAGAGCICKALAD